MKRFFLKIAKLLLITIVMYVPIYYILVLMHVVNPMPSFHHEIRNTEVKFNEIKNYHDVDILFVGASNAYRSFDIRKFSDNGLYTFNMGTTAQSPVQSYLLLRRFLDSLRPNFVVMAVAPVIMNNPTESTLDFLWSDFEDDKIQWEITKLQMGLSCRSMHIINTWIYNALYHNVYAPIFIQKDTHLNTNRHLEGEDMLIDSVDMYIRGGYVERMKNLINFPQKHEPIKMSISPMQLYYLKKCAYLLDSRNIPFVFVETPIQRTCYIAWENHKNWENKLREYNYLNYNELPIFNDSTDFYDSYHMNKYGVEKFDSLFISDIKSILPTKKSIKTNKTL